MCLHNGSVNSAGWRFRKDGGQFWVSVLTIALYKNDIHIGFGQVACDRTEQREAEMVSEAAMEEHEAFNCMFRAKVSHDQLDESQLNQVGVIEMSGDAMLQRVDDSLDIASNS
ncbi:hypothetical protein Purlil1_14206 [Purpureocillium lilacinum]|uniref:PAC domain-containing protein n=1 Tax=Purpureocillium lilacinum TaxID=33203 RepID=A0ABR0BBX9_PURLI|nr:hypothetical protein Purlil1_14206 [Purpureocillium lilacinum]